MASASTDALATHPGPVLEAFRDRLAADDRAGEVLLALAGATAPAPARGAAALVAAYAARAGRRPGGAAHTAACVDRGLDRGPAARAVLLPLVTGVLRAPDGACGRPALAPVLVGPGPPPSHPLRDELLGVLLDVCPEDEYGTLGAHLEAAAHTCEARPEPRTRELVLRTALLLTRTSEGSARWQRRIVRLAGEAPAFAELLAQWLARAPQEWSGLTGPALRRAVVARAGPIPVRADGPGHGSLRPA
ncbi:hypothetical protein [Streptomyces sp. NPDC001985]|uniref:hypothetical protein n=1 Tax=Streptomyces sp. NPDC001985 TaxID=3154406 RepID=UPI00331DD368